MTEDDKYAFKEFRNGVALTLGVVGFGMLIIAGLASVTQTDIDQPSFEVVDTYKGCDVVRYTPHQEATYKYFLHCEDKQPTSQAADKNRSFEYD